jgi:F420-non-reducing hydrogenase small subunit
MNKLTVGTLCLASCTGCHMALLDTQEEFLALLEDSDLVFSPVLMDRKEIVPADVVLVEGGVRNTEDLERLQEARAKATFLIALGTCATFGGVPGLADGRSMQEVLDAVYAREALGPDVPAQRARLLPLDSHVEVDYLMPGCPPPRGHMVAALKALATGGEPPRIDTPVCSECRRKAVAEPLAEILRPISRAPLPDKCMLVQGFLCLGSVTRGGCGAACPQANVPCSGCRGPTDHILTESRHGVYRDIVHRISHLLDLPVKEVEKRVGDLPHVLYSYSLASPAMRRKDAESVARLVYRIKE